jgi:hypothetical protein
MAQGSNQHSIRSNLQYRLTKGDLPDLSFGVEKPKNVEVSKGADELLQTCLKNTATWSKDPLLFRLAHTHPATIQSFRENNSPSMHVIFRQVPGEPLKAWLHFDGHGSQGSGSRIIHLGEFTYHKITFQNNDQDRMFENLQRSFSSPTPVTVDSTASLTNGERLTLFSNKTLTRVQPYASSAVSSATLLLFSPSPVWGQGADRFTNHFVASFTQRLVTYGVQSGAAALLHEDVRYKPSQSHSAWQRTQHALISTLILETPHGNDIAIANIAAALGSGIVIDKFHPGRENAAHPGALEFAGWNLLGFAEGNLWNEFKPDLRHLIRSKILHRQ